jgi:signal transduction histidine kinase
MMSRLLNKILKLLLTIFLLPLYILKGIKKIFVQLFRNLKFSIRKKISFNYLLLYTIICIITLITVTLIFVPYEINEKNLIVEGNIEKLINQYELGVYDIDDFEQKINYISELNNCGIEVTINDVSNLDTRVIISQKFNTYDYPDSVWEKIELVFSDALYLRSAKKVYEKNGLDIQYKVKILYYLYPLNDVLFLILTLSFCFICGFFFIGTIGGIKSRQVLEPIYTMTKTAEKISINDMRARLDVSKTKYELKDLANTLNDMLDRLNKDYDKQKRFVSDVSHELRTPISIINGYANMLERWGKEDQDVLNESIDAIIGEAKNMQLLVENLLTLVRSDNQTLQYNKSEFYMDKLVYETIKEISMIDEIGHNITYNLEEKVKVFLDSSKTKQMLRIFLDNAIKYTPANGTIDIKVYSNGDLCNIEIKDSGIGISKDDLPHLFNRFYRSDESRTRETGGHGLGLAIAKVIVIGQKGQIKVKSKLNKWSVFVITLPR